MRTAQRILLDITSSASALQLSIETSATQIAQMATIGGLTSAILQWGWVGFGVACIYQFSSRYAGYAAATLGMSGLLDLTFNPTKVLTGFILFAKSTGLFAVFENIPKDTVLIHYASGYQIPLVPVLKVATLLTLAIGIIVLHRFQRPVSTSKCPPDNPPFDLRFLKMSPCVRHCPEHL
jgi:hypothetical protein